MKSNLRSPGGSMVSAVLLGATIALAASACGVSGNGPDSAATGGGGEPGYTSAGTTSGGGGSDNGGSDANQFSDVLPASIEMGGPSQPSLSPACQQAFARGDTRLILTIPSTRDYASPLQARGVIESGTAPEASILHAGAFLNYYRNRYPDPPAGKIGIYPELDQGALPNEWILQIGVQTPPAPAMRQKKVSVTVVVDTSLSMAIGGDNGGMARAKAAVQALGDALNTGDKLNVITTAPAAKPSVVGITGPNDPGVKAEVERLAVDGGEDFTGALAQAYTQAYQAASDPLFKDGLNRVVLITDGALTAEAIDGGQIRDGLEKQGIRFVSVGVGPAALYRDTVLAEAARAGNGANVFLDTPAAADELLRARFDEIMDVAASGVLLDLTVPWIFEVEAQELDVVTGDKSSLSPTEIGPGRSIAYRRVLRACDGAIVAGYPTAPLKIQLAWTPASAPEIVDTTLEKVLSDGHFELRKTSAILAYTDALRTLDPKRLSAVHTTIGNLLFSLGGQPDPELEAIRALIEKNPLYKP